VEIKHLRDHYLATGGHLVTGASLPLSNVSVYAFLAVGPTPRAPHLPSRTIAPPHPTRTLTHHTRAATHLTYPLPPPHATHSAHTQPLPPAYRARSRPAAATPHLTHHAAAASSSHLHTAHTLLPPTHFATAHIHASTSRT